MFLLFFALPSLKKIRRNKFSSTFDLFNFCLASTIYNVYISMFFVLQAHFPCEEKCLGEFIKQFTIMPVPFHFLDFRVLFLFDFQHHQHLFLPLVSQFDCVVVFGGRHSGSPTGWRKEKLARLRQNVWQKWRIQNRNYEKIWDKCAYSISVTSRISLKPTGNRPLYIAAFPCHQGGIYFRSVSVKKGINVKVKKPRFILPVLLLFVFVWLRIRCYFVTISHAWGTL